MRSLTLLLAKLFFLISTLNFVGFFQRQKIFIDVPILRWDRYFLDCWYLWKMIFDMLNSKFCWWRNSVASSILSRVAPGERLHWRRRWTQDRRVAAQTLLVFRPGVRTQTTSEVPGDRLVKSVFKLVVIQNLIGDIIQSIMSLWRKTNS